jgi:branched-chain amino acid transport system permease protein
VTRARWAWIVLALAGLVALAGLPQVIPVYFTHLLILALIYGLAAMSLDILLGFAGLVSFGHAAYFGAAAYIVAVLTLRFHLHPSLAMAAGVVGGGLLAAVFGLLATRATAVYFIIITLALGMGTWGLAYRWVSVTGGDNGLPGIPPLDLGFGWPLREAVNVYYFTVGVVALAAFLLFRFVTSPFGLTLRGIRESESRMRVLGFNTWLHKYVAFVVAGSFAGLAGTLYAAYNGFVSPPDVHLAASAEQVLMVILGGAGTLFGPMVGAGIVVFLRNMVSAYTHRWLLILGVVYILTVMYAPTGVLGALRTLELRLRLRAAPRPLPTLANPDEPASGPSREGE